MPGFSLIVIQGCIFGFLLARADIPVWLGIVLLVVNAILINVARSLP